jgi:hypothetical protein
MKIALSNSGLAQSMTIVGGRGFENGLSNRGLGMVASLSHGHFLAFAVIQVFGLFSALMARSAVVHLRRSPCHWAFFLALFLVSGVTLATVLLGTQAWIISGSTLTLMVVMAVWDGGEPETI